MILLALDQSSHTSGYAIFNDSELISHGTFTFNDVSIGVRLQKIKKKVSQLIKDYEVDFVIIEDIALDKGKQEVGIMTFKMLAEVIGVLFELFVDLNIKNDAVLAKVWRKTLAFSNTDRKSQKKEAIEYVLKKYMLSATEDEAEAICIGTHYILSNQEDGFDWSN